MSTTLEDQLTNALDRRSTAVNVEYRLDAIVDGTNVVRLDGPPPRRRRRLLSVAAAVVLLAVGAVAVTQIGGGNDEFRDDGPATRPDVPEGGSVLPQPLSAIESLADDWVIPTRLPGGFDYQYAFTFSEAGDSQSPRSVYFGNDDDQPGPVSVGIVEQDFVADGSELEVDGVVWDVSTSGELRFADRQLGSDVITVVGDVESDEAFTDLIDSLVVVADSGLPAAPLVYDEFMTPVGTFDADGRTFPLTADGSNGWYCTRSVSESGGGGGCATFFEPARHLQSSHDVTWTSSDGADRVDADVTGLASVETALVEVEWTDGTVTTIEPQNTSDRFPDVRFWVTGATIDLADGQTPDEVEQPLLEVRALAADGSLLAVSRDGVVTVEPR